MCVHICHIHSCSHKTPCCTLHVAKYKGNSLTCVTAHTHTQRGRAEESSDPDDVENENSELSEDEQDDDDIPVDPSTSQPPGQ